MVKSDCIKSKLILTFDGSTINFTLINPGSDINRGVDSWSINNDEVKIAYRLSQSQAKMPKLLAIIAQV